MNQNPETRQWQPQAGWARHPEIEPSLRILLEEQGILLEEQEYSITDVGLMFGLSREAAERRQGIPDPHLQNVPTEQTEATMTTDTTRIPASLEPEAVKASETAANKMNRKLLLEAQKMSGLTEKDFAKRKLGRDRKTFQSWKECRNPIPDAAITLIRSIHSEYLRTQERRDRQGISRERQADLLKAANARRFG